MGTHLLSLFRQLLQQILGIDLMDAEGGRIDASLSPDVLPFLLAVNGLDVLGEVLQQQSVHLGAEGVTSSGFTWLTLMVGAVNKDRNQLIDTQLRLLP